MQNHLPPRPDERAWIRSLDDRALARLVQGLSAVDRAVRNSRDAIRQEDGR
jgi:hypothetical protein